LSSKVPNGIGVNVRVSEADHRAVVLGDERQDRGLLRVAEAPAPSEVAVGEDVTIQVGVVQEPAIRVPPTLGLQRGDGRSVGGPAQPNPVHVAGVPARHASDGR
jgi:hypothetical protein